MSCDCGHMPFHCQNQKKKNQKKKINQEKQIKKRKMLVSNHTIIQLTISCLTDVYYMDNIQQSSFHFQFIIYYILLFPHIYFVSALYSSRGFFISFLIVYLRMLYIVNRYIQLQILFCILTLYKLTYFLLLFKSLFKLQFKLSLKL